MKNTLFAILTLGLFSTLDGSLAIVQAQSTTFTYQGRLNNGTNVAAGNFDLRFAIFNAVTAGAQQGGLLTNSAVVSNGLFMVALDFGNQFPGADRWLEIAVRTNGGGAFTTLVPRQPLTPTPYAVFANTASNLTGTVPLAQLPAGVITNGASGVNFSGAFNGNGAGVTNLNLGLNSSGAIAMAGGFTLVSSPVVGAGPHSITTADVNADGKPDVISANNGTGTGNTLSVLTNSGAGGFVLASTPVVGTGAYAVTAADVNLDGKIDLICANYGSGTGNTLSVLTNKGGGTFALASSLAVGTGPTGVTSADVNGDGKPDLISANNGNTLGTSLTVLTNNGTGGFALASSPTVGIGAFSVVAVDVNGDGKPDLISANRKAGTLTVLTNISGGSFVLASSPLVGATPVSIATADINGDGKVDLITEDLANEFVLVLTNSGNGNFAPYFSIPAGGVFSITTADVNGDGKPDLIYPDFNVNLLLVLTNNVGAGFGSNSPVAVGDGPVSVVAADVNGDGKPDVICANARTNTLSVLFNTPAFNGTFNGVFNGSGRITSPMWNATTPVNFGGSLPSTNQFTAHGGTLVFSVSGSGYCTVAGTVGMNILVDGVSMGTCEIYANVVNVHIAFVPKTLVRTGVSAGTHSIALQPLAGTLSNFDNYCVTLLEFPF